MGPSALIIVGLTVTGYRISGIFLRVGLVDIAHDIRLNVCRYLSLSFFPVGDLQLMTNKAACAVHMYGQQCEYVIRVSDVLYQRDNREMFSFLQLHKENSLGLHLYFQQNNNAR